MMIDPLQASTKAGGAFTIDVVVSATTPVNAFAGEVQFDSDILSVVKIDYNNSIADLWAKVPWYQNGEGTINFAGGTTVTGGFTGSGSLLTVTFATKKTGVTNVVISSAQILKHDGYGSNTTVATSQKSLFTIMEDPTTIPETTIVNQSTQVVVGTTPDPLDLSGDGKHTIADVSIFMTHLVANNTSSDFNQDGKVTLADLSILLDGR